MQKTLTTVGTIAVLTLCVSHAAAQNPFAIEGVVTVDTNSKSPTGNAPRTGDPSGNSKEFGPKNGSPQQVGNIHTAPIPMLADTNPNGNNDLNAVWVSNEQAADLHYWLYFGWSRDTAGTGIIGIELAATPSGCDYGNLLACNPWGNRAGGDVVFVWDTKGGSTQIVKRVFVDTNGAGTPGGVVLPACPQNFPTVETDECSVVSNSIAVFSDDNLEGEVAIDLTAEDLLPLDECRTFSNIIPFSGTGNSDTADIKDAVLNPFPPITNCGVVTVKKVLLNLTNLTGTFNYTLDKGAGDVQFGVPSVSGTLTHHNDLDTIPNVTPGTDFTLAETSASSPFTKQKIYCTVNNTTYVVYDASGGATVANFPVVGGTTTACIIENKAVGSPQGTTVQSGRLHDQMNLTNVLAHSGLVGTVTFSLWKNSNNCSANQMLTGPGGSGTIVTDVIFVAATQGQLTTGVANTLNTVGFGTSGSGVYYWKVQYSGDTINTPLTFCTENTVITFND